MKKQIKEMYEISQGVGVGKKVPSIHWEVINRYFLKEHTPYTLMHAMEKSLNSIYMTLVLITFFSASFKDEEDAFVYRIS